jgi:hypothetical protein
VWVRVELIDRRAAAHSSAPMASFPSCPICDALKRLPQIDDAEADRIVVGSEMSAWCERHLAAWLDVRDRGDTTGCAHLRAIILTARKH